MKRWWLVVIAANLIGIITLAFVYASPMLAPGPLIPAHAAISGDCFACHTPMQGATGARCITCHAVAGIGVTTVAGAPIARARTMAPFHQALADSDCMSCHTDHPPVSLAPAHSHTFAHAMLTPAMGAACSSCHVAPVDTVHTGMTAQCSTCHGQTDWSAATIDHSRFFSLTGPHDVACTTCHTRPDNFSTFTCFTCHEHQEAALIRSHREEGIQNIDNCVACHRNAHAEDDEGDDD